MEYFIIYAYSGGKACFGPYFTYHEAEKSAEAYANSFSDVKIVQTIAVAKKLIKITSVEPNEQITK